MNRKAELQRKLAIAPVPKPPADLAKRIKSEIPEKLRAENEAERERLSDSIALNLRVAASILVLISTAFLALHLLSRANEQPAATAAVTRQAAPAVLTASASESAAAAPPTQTIAQPQAIAAHEPARAKRQVTQVAALEKKKNEEETPKDTRDEVAFAPPPPKPAAPAAEAAVSAPAATPQFITVTGSAPSVAAKTASNMADKAMSYDDATLEKYAAPDSLPARYALDVEAVENPFESGKALVRASADWGRIASVRLDITPAVGSGWHWGSSRYGNSSHTMVVELPSGQSLTIGLRYTPGDEPEQTTATVVTATDVKPWSEASRRTKAAVLVWLWKHGADPAAVAVKAREAGLDDLAGEIER